MFGKRIAQKIWLGYAIPLAVLVVAGLLVPAALSAILARVSRGYESNAQLVTTIREMEYAVLESQSHLRGYALYRNDESSRTYFRRQYARSRARYEQLRQAARTLAAGDADLLLLLIYAERAYRGWQRNIAAPQLLDQPISLRGSTQQQKFERVGDSFEQLIKAATLRRDRQARRAEAASRVRQAMALLGPAVALILALLIGRSISLGVTRPLESLTRATEVIERGQQPGLFLDDEDASDSDDEIGELKRSFAHMARTIGQREAVLRAQNEALGALNRRVEAVLNSTNDGIVMLDRGGGFSVVNQRFADLFDIDAETLLDQTFAQAGPLLLSRFQDKDTVRDRLRQLLPDPDAVTDETYEIIEPERRVLRVYSAPVRGETPSGGGAAELLGRIFVFRDVTRETAVDRMKTEFISVVSHELRTPLTAIRGYVELMLAGQTGAINELQQEFLTIVESSTTRLTALINDMLDISRIESGRVEVRRDRVDYAKVVHEAVATLAREAEAKQIALSAQVPHDLPPVSGDADRIAQVLMNLLSNGIKYTPQGGRVTVRVDPAETFLTTCIEDTGIGIALEDQPRLFQKFFRADNSTTREASGTGLGLAITKAIIEKLGGAIWVQSEPGEGSSFFFTLPAAGVALSAGGDTATSTRGAGLVLCVDDDPTIVRLLSHQMERRGFRTVAATDGREALRQARELSPDAITLDIMMPGMDGFAVLRKLKTDEATREIPVILLSVLANDRPSRVPEAFAFLKKPIDETQLAAVVRAAVAQRHERATVLVVGSNDHIAACLRERFGDQARVVTAATLDEARAGAEETPPVLVLLDPASAAANATGLMAFLHERHAIAQVPFVVVTEEEVCGDGVIHMTPLCQGPLSLEQLAGEVGKLLEKDEFEISPPQRAPHDDSKESSRADSAVVAGSGWRALHDEI